MEPTPPSGDSVRTGTRPSWVTVTKYLIGEADSAEVRQVDGWVSDSQERRSGIAILRAWWITKPVDVHSIRTESALSDVLARVQTSISPDTQSPPRKASRGRAAYFGKHSRILGPRLRRRMMWSAAASVVLGAIITAVGWEGGVQRDIRSATSVLTYTTNPGQRANIALPDGSTVALNVASRLDVPADYGRGHHTVRLLGEALFTVAHRDRAPFTVQVGPTTVSVLGTSFVVRDYATDSTTLVAVRDGKVAVRSAIVAAQQEIEVGNGKLGRIRPVDPTRFSFATGVLTLDRVPFPTAIEELNRWYDADIRLGDSKLRSQQVTAKLKVGSLTDLAELLAVTFNVRVVRDGRVLTLFSR